MASSDIKPTAVVELTIAATLWGFGFVAATWALQSLGPLGVTGWRLTIAFVFGALIVAAVPRLRREFNLAEFRMAFWPGIFMAGTLLLQAWGLKYTTAAKSGFITTLYVLIVPLLERLFLRRHITRFHLVYVFLALLGVALVCELPQMLMSSGHADVTDRERWNFGDWLTLLCALLASLQIFWFGFIQDRITSSFNFNVYQTFWAALLPLPFALWLEPTPRMLSGLPLAGMLALIFGATLIAFALQVRAQKSISPSLASLLFLLESPFAALFGLLLLGERWTAQGAVGALLILVALGSSVVFNKEASSTDLSVG